MNPMLRLLLVTLMLSSCSWNDGKMTVECSPTVAHMTPPHEVKDFFIGGATDKAAAEEAWARNPPNMYGNEALWVLLPRGGRLHSLGEKIGAYRIRTGRITIDGRRLDGAPGRPHGDASQGYGDRGFQPTGVSFPSPGCWEVVYELNGSELRFVLEVQSEQ